MLKHRFGKLRDSRCGLGYKMRNLENDVKMVLKVVFQFLKACYEASEIKRVFIDISIHVI